MLCDTPAKNVRSSNLRHLLICGLGSVGQRHLRHFRALGVEKIDSFRTGLATLVDKDGPRPDRTYDKLPDALRSGAEAVVISNPTALHQETALECLRAGVPVLIEKPIANSLEGARSLVEESARRGLVAAAAHNLRFHPSLRLLNRWASTREPYGCALEAQIHFGTYLPAWHPWEPYLRSYAARSELGGGVSLTHIHELDYAVWLFGDVARATVLRSRRHTLGTDVDEAAAFALEHVQGTLTTVSMSFLERPTRRSVDVVFEKASISADLLTTRVSVRTASEGSVLGSARAFDFDSTYREQASDFISAVSGASTPLVPVREALESLRIALLRENAQND